MRIDCPYGAVYNACLKPSSDNFDSGYFGPGGLVARAIHDPGSFKRKEARLFDLHP